MRADGRPSSWRVGLLGTRAHSVHTSLGLSTRNVDGYVPCAAINDVLVWPCYRPKDTLTRNSCQADSGQNGGMLTKAQHARQYGSVPPLLRKMREDAGLTQRDLGKRLGKPQSWIHNCESANRRVDVTEFISWSEASGVNPRTGLARLMKAMRL